MQYKNMNKTEKEVYTLSRSIKDLTPKEVERILATSDNNFKSFRKSSRSTFAEYYVVFQRVGSWQVIRHFMVRRTKYRHWQREFFEAMRHWVSPDKEPVAECRLRYIGNYILDNWRTDSKLEVRRDYAYQWNDIHNIGWTYLIKRSLIPELKRMNFRRLLAAPYYFTLDILQDGRLEMLYRLGLYKLIDKFYNTCRFCILDWQWTALRIALRHHYDFSTKSKVDMWYDLVYCVHRLGLDIHSPHYVAPDDLKAMHDTLYRRIQNQNEMRAARERESSEYKQYNDKEWQKERENEYKSTHAPYLPIAFENEHFTAHVLQSVKEFLDEGIAMDHCVFACRYYAKENSVILSIRNHDNKRLETCEVDVNKGIILQCYGKHDRFTQHHKEIKDFVNANIWRFTEKNKEAAV